MADWEDASDTAMNSLQNKMLMNDAALQSAHPNWPTGGTATQLGIESNYNNDAVSPKGARGIGQFMPDTWKAIEEQTGRKLDINNVNDQLFAHRYLMQQNLDRVGGDTNKALSLYNSGKPEANNPETQNYVANFNKKTQATAAPSPSSDWEDAPTAPASGAWEDAPIDKTSIWQNIKGAGMQAANLAAGAIETPAILGAGAIGGVGRALGGEDIASNLEKTMQNIGQNYQMLSPENALNKLGVDTSGIQKTAGYQLPAEALNYLGNTLPQQLAEAGGPNSPFAAAQQLTPYQQRVAKPALQIAELAAPFLHRGGGAVGESGGVPSESLGKLAPDEAAAPSAIKPSEFVGPQQEGMGPLQEQPNAGPQRPIIVDTEGKALPAGQEPTVEQLGAELGRERFASQLEQNKPVSEYNTVEARAGAVVHDPIETIDPTSDTPHPTENIPAERIAAPEEFTQAVQTLVDRAPDKFSLPADMDKAYDRYTQIVSGAVDNVGKMAKNFTEAVRDQMMEDRINNHPTVRANQARVDSLQARLADAQAKQGPTSALESQLARVQATLDKSRENIGKYFEPVSDSVAPKVGPDGTVHMYTFGHLPTMMKSIGAVLKALHGVAFKTLDRLIPNLKNLDSGPKIMAQGIKDFVNKQATRDWSQTVNEKEIGQISKTPGLREAVNTLNPHAQEELSPEQLKTQFNSAPDLSDSKVGNALRNNVLQGGLMISDFSNHPLVKYVTDSVAKAFRSSDKWSRENLLNKQTGLRALQQKMPLQHFTEIRSLMEAYEGIKEFKESELRSRGYTDDQIKYYNRSLELQKDALTKYNQGQVLAGKPPVEARIAHIAGYFTGDFKQIVKDSEGRVVAVLGHNNRTALGTIAKRFQELHPDGAILDMGKPFLRRGSVDDNTFLGFMNILNEMSKTNADVDRLVQAYHDVQMANTNKLSQMANRAKFKTSPENRVGGAEGQKLWQSMEKNAQDGGKQQLKYLESLNRWSEFQKAFQKSQDFVSDPEVNAPHAKAVSQAYLDNQMHRNLGELNKFTNAIASGVAEITGVGPSQMRQISNFTKTGLLNMYVGLGKLSHSLVTTLQPFIGMPEVTSVMKARGEGIRPIAQATSMLQAIMDNKDILQSLVTKQPIKDPFLRAANQYAKDNDTFNTSQFNMGTVTRQPTKLGTALHINVTVPESGARAFTYMRYVRLLKDASDHAPEDSKLSDQDIFGAAHNATQKVMADYNREAAAPIYNKMGFLGDLTRMLTTFKMNQISQAATATKLMKQGQVAPMITMLASSVASAGLRGFIGYNIANGLIGQITTWASKNGLMSQPTNLDQMLLHMMHGMNSGMRDALNFGATSFLGIDMTGSLSHADDLPNDPLGTLVPEAPSLIKTAGSWAKFVEHPNIQRGKAAVYDTLPNAWKGVMEDLPYKEGQGLGYTDEKGNYYDPHTGNLVTTRTPADQAKRALSFRPLEQSKERLIAETDRNEKTQQGAVRSELTDRMLSDADSKDLTPAVVSKYMQQYIQNKGDPNELVSALVKHVGMDRARNLLQREQGTAQGFTGAERYQQTEQLK
jgi:Transglycosylase SLT domain